MHVAKPFVSPDAGLCVQVGVVKGGVEDLQLKVLPEVAEPVLLPVDGVAHPYDVVLGQGEA